MNPEPGSGNPSEVEAADQALAREPEVDLQDEVAAPPGPTDDAASVARRSPWRDRSFWGHTGQATVVVWLGHLAILASSIVLARTLTVPAFGAVVLATSVVGVISSLLDLTLDEAVVYHGVRAHLAGRFGELKGVIRSAVVLDVLIGLAIWALIVIAAVPIAEVASGGELDPDLIRLASFIALATTLDGSTGAALFIVRKAQVRAALMGFAGIARFGLVLLVAPTRSQAGILLCYAGASALAAALQVFVAWRLAWRPLPQAPVEGGLRTWLRPLFRFGAHTSVTTTIASAEAGIVPIILARSAGVQEAAILAVATLPVTIALVGSSPLRIMLLPEQARLSASGALATLRKVLKQYVVGALGIGIAAAALGWLLLPVLIPALYSDRYEVAVGPARILLIAAIARLSTVWSKNFAGAIGRPELRTRMMFLELSMVVVLLFLLGSRGAEGAAWALTISYSVMAVLWCLLSGRLLSDSKEGSLASPGRALGRRRQLVDPRGNDSDVIRCGHASTSAGSQVWASPLFVEAWSMRRRHARDTEEVRPGVPRRGRPDRSGDR